MRITWQTRVSLYVGWGTPPQLYRSSIVSECEGPECTHQARPWVITAHALWKAIPFCPDGPGTCSLPAYPAPPLATQRGIIRNIEHTFRTLGSSEVMALEVSVGIGRLHLDSCGGWRAFLIPPALGTEEPRLLHLPQTWICMDRGAGSNGYSRTQEDWTGSWAVLACHFLLRS